MKSPAISRGTQASLAKSVANSESKEDAPSGSPVSLLQANPPLQRPLSSTCSISDYRRTDWTVTMSDLDSIKTLDSRRRIV